MPTMKAELLVLEFLRRDPTQTEVNYYAALMPNTWLPGADHSKVPPLTYDGNVLGQIKAIMITTEYKARPTEPAHA